MVIEYRSLATTTQEKNKPGITKKKKKKALSGYRACHDYFVLAKSSDFGGQGSEVRLDDIVSCVMRIYEAEDDTKWLWMSRQTGGDDQVC